MKRLPKRVDEAAVSAEGDVIYYVTDDGSEEHKSVNLPKWAKDAILEAVENARENGYDTAKKKIREVLGVK